MEKKNLSSPKCLSCNKKFKEEKSIFYNLIRDPFCKSCFDAEWKCNSVLCSIEPDSFKMTVFSAGSLYKDSPLPYPITKVFWVGNDDSRGYTYWKVEEEYTDLAKGWITEFPDRTNTPKKELNSLLKKIKTRKLVPPLTFYWVMGITSNPFSQISAIITTEKNMDKLLAWFSENGYPQSALDQMFA